MRRFIATVAILSPFLNLLAAEPDLAAVRALGATLKESDGVPTSLQVDCTNLTDDDYRLIASVKTLKSLSISGKPFSDKQLELLTGLSEIDSILINGTQLTDDGYVHFAAFRKLKTLSLFHPSRDCEGFTGAGLAHLKALPNLERLTFAGATAGDAAYAAISQLPQIRSFREWHNGETASGKKQLAKLENLTSLKLGQRLPQRGQPPVPSFNDETLAWVSQMPALEQLELSEARLSFAGLEQLKALPNLQRLTISQVDVSKEDIEKLRLVLLKVKIEWEPLNAEGEEMLSKKLKLN